jgi:hypothetical protein
MQARLLFFVCDVQERRTEMILIAGGILLSIVILVFAGFMLTVSADWIFKAPKDGPRYQTPNRPLGKNRS